MKFTNGYWLLRDEMKAAYAVEYGSHRVYGQELTMYLPCSHIVDRGSCLNIPLLTVTLSSPMDGVIKVSAVIMTEPYITDRLQKFILGMRMCGSTRMRSS